MDINGVTKEVNIQVNTGNSDNKIDPNQVLKDDQLVDVGSVNPGILSRMYFFTAEFWDKVFIKILEALISVKVWGLTFCAVSSTYLLMNKYITGDNWVSINTLIFGTIYAVREVFSTTTIQDIYQKMKNGPNSASVSSNNDNT